MKTTRISFIALMAVGLILAGCSKEGDSPTGTYPQDEAKAITDKDKQEFIDDMIDRLPNIAIYNQTMDQYILVDWDQAKNGFNFASPSGGISFSGPGGTIEFVEGPSGGYYQVVSPGGSGGASGGVVTAGPVALDITYVVCFNSGDGEEGFDLFDIGAGFSGLSGAVGIGGDFEALMMGEFDENSDPFEYLWGMVAYYAFDGTANGSYPIVNFLEAPNEPESFLENKGLAYLISFQGEGGIFFSVDGNVTFSGNSVTFNGTYWGVTDVLIGFGDGFDPDEEPQYIEAPGFGTLTCQ